jgi:hypothetical protein
VTGRHPRILIEHIDHFYGGDWLDPCPLDPAFDALREPWPAAHHIFVKMPYGREIGRWVARALAEGEGLGADLILLLPAR